jgi:glycosyltransferase involved in cell wall biosynthesis
MKEEGLISIIVPVYNVVGYIDRCISSIVAQTYKNIEIVIVDDGSTDESGDICDKWGNKDSRIQVYHKRNGGLSSARNFGLSKINGEFIGFVDSDDYVAEDMYESLLNHMDNDVDITECGFLYNANMGRMKNNRFYKARVAPKVLKMPNEVAMGELLRLRYSDFSVCTKLVRRKLWGNIRFPHGRSSEDLPVTYELVKRSRNVVNIGKAKYFYIYRNDSTTKKPFEIRRIDYVLFCIDILKDVRINYPLEAKMAEALYIEGVIITWKKIESNQISRQKYKYIQDRLRNVLRRMLVRILMNKYIADYNKKNVISIILEGYKTDAQNNGI